MWKPIRLPHLIYLRIDKSKRSGEIFQNAFLLYPIGERSLLAAMEILIDELLDLLGVVLDILAERLVIEGLQLGNDAVDHGW